MHNKVCIFSATTVKLYDCFPISFFSVLTSFCSFLFVLHQILCHWFSVCCSDYIPLFKFVRKLSVKCCRTALVGFEPSGKYKEQRRRWDWKATRQLGALYTATRQIISYWRTLAAITSFSAWSTWVASQKKDCEMGLGFYSIYLFSRWINVIFLCLCPMHTCHNPQSQ